MNTDPKKAVIIATEIWDTHLSEPATARLAISAIMNADPKKTVKIGQASGFYLTDHLYKHGNA
ncbi:hypothetical protein ACLHZ0_12895 [Aeromonas salmonicida]|uniref:hypothetical protein n=1 Tax=Aeromonas salmonicida TaxID=645 RepID=UPI0038D3AB9A